MSHIRVKTIFETEGAYGSREKHVLYAHLNLSCDITTFYDENGEHLFSFEDTERNNLFEAMKRLAAPMKDSRNNHDLVDSVEYMNEEDRKKCDL